MLNIKQLIQLSKQLQKFGETETDNGILIYDGEIAEGVEVYVEQDGEVIPAPDAEYTTEDKVIVVAEGKVAEIKDKEAEKPAEEEETTPVEEKEEETTPAEEETKPEEEAAPDEKDAKIAELEARIAELEAENADLKAKLGVAEEELSKPVKTETKLEKEQPRFKTYIKK